MVRQILSLLDNSLIYLIQYHGKVKYLKQRKQFKLINTRAIFPVINTTYFKQKRKLGLKKIQTYRGFEPMTSAILMQC